MPIGFHRGAAGGQILKLAYRSKPAPPLAGTAGILAQFVAADAQRQVDAWIGQFEEGYFHPLTNLARLTEEVGELAREVNHRFGEKTKKPGEPEGDLGMEMADILFVLICMANREGIDLQAAFDRMMAKVETRDGERWTKKREVTGER